MNLVVGIGDVGVGERRDRSSPGGVYTIQMISSRHGLTTQLILSLLVGLLVWSSFEGQFRSCPFEIFFIRKGYHKFKFSLYYRM